MFIYPFLLCPERGNPTCLGRPHLGTTPISPKLPFPAGLSTHKYNLHILRLVLEATTIFDIVIGFGLSTIRLQCTIHMSECWHCRPPWPHCCMLNKVDNLSEAPNSEHRPKDALKSLTKLRGLPETDERVQLEYKSIITEVEFQRLAEESAHPGAKGLKLEWLLWTDLLKRKMWRRTVVAVGVCFFQQFSGINAFIYYAPTLFRSIGQSDEMSLVLSGVFNSLQLVAVILCFLIIDKVGRRPLAIIGGFGTAVCYTIISILAGLYSTDWASNVAAGWACVAMAFAFIMVFGVSYSPLGWTLPAEVYSTSSRAKGVALATCVNWLANFTVGIATPPMLENISFGTYIFFACFCLMAGLWAYFLVPETMGRTLEQMDEVFGDTAGQKEAELMAQAVNAATGIVQRAETSPV